MTTLRLAPGLELPLDAVTKTHGILAKRRVGKTYTASVMAEEFAKAQLPFVVLDPTGAWWGLRSSADGRREGLPVVIIGGEHGDLPLEPAAGKVLADLVVEHPGFYVLDLSGTASNAEQDRFATDFAERLYRRKAQARDPLHLFVDEADSFIPQRPMPGQQRMLGAFEAVVRRGGIRGLGTTLITQRAAVLNKNVLEQLDVLIALQITGPNDRASIDDWVKGHGTPEQRKEVLGSLASLGRGEGWYWEPGRDVFQRVRIRERKTFNSSATPEPGQRQVQPTKLATVDLEALRGRIAATIEKVKADDPKELRAQVAQLKRELAAAQAKPAPAAAPAPEPVRVEVPIFAAGELQRLEEASDRALAAAQAVRDATQELREAQSEVSGCLDRARQLAAHRPAAAPIAARPRSPAVPAGRTPAAAAVPRAPSAVGDPELTGPAQRILDALAELAALGVSPAPRTQVALFAGYSNLSSKGFANAISLLTSGGYVGYPTPGTVALTPRGQAYAVQPPEPRTSEELQARALALLKGTSARLLGPLLEAYPEPLARAELAQKAGYTNLSSKGFANEVSRLRSLGFIDYPGQGQVVAAPILFLD